MSKAIEKKIRELFNSHINGYAFKSDSFSITKEDGMLPVLKITNVGNSGKTNFSNAHYHKSSGYEKFIANVGDLAFSLTGSLGYVAVVTQKCLVNQRVFVIKRIPSYEKLLDAIQPFIKSLSFTNYCYSYATSESNKNISPKIILDYKVPVFIKEGSIIDFEKQNEFAQKYRDIEEKKEILLDKIELLKSHKIVFDEINDIEYVNINLNEAIVHHNGKSAYTREWCQEHRGKFPLYSANNSRPIATMDKADYDGRFLTYSKNGCAGYITILDGKFSVNGDRCVITLNKEYKSIDLLYLKYYLEPIFRANIKGRMGINGKNEYTKINSTMIKKLNIQVPIPINDKGEYDLDKQQELAQKYATIETIKQNLYNQVKELVSITIN